MNRTDVAIKLPLITAFAKGEQIEFRRKSSGEGYKWQPCGDNLSFSSAYEYRIKPEPEKIYSVYSKEDVRVAACTRHSHADTILRSYPGGYIKTFVEESCTK